MELYFSNFRPLACFSVTIPEAVYCNFDLLMMSTTVLETCRGMLGILYEPKEECLIWGTHLSTHPSLLLPSVSC